MAGRWRKVRASAAGWALTRAALVATAMAGVYPMQQHVSSDVSRYQAWSLLMVHGRLPSADPAWQYPPLAAIPMVIARALPGHYLIGFVVEMLVVDAIGWWLLARRGDATGAWLWVVGLAALGPVTWYRFDLVPAVLAIAAVQTGGVLGGFFAAAGGWVKVWPAVALPLLRRPVRAVTAAAVTTGAGVVALAATGRLEQAWSFVHHQGSRGLQVESVAATPIVAAVAWGSHTPARFASGSYEFTGGVVGTVDAVSTVVQLVIVVVLLATAVLAARRGRPLPPATATLAAMLALLVVTRVFSPQYLVWVIGLAAVALCLREPGVRPVAVALVVAAGASQWLYPAHYVSFLDGGSTEAVDLILRNAAVVVALGLSVRALRRHPAGPHPR